MATHLDSCVTKSPFLKAAPSNLGSRLSNGTVCEDGRSKPSLWRSQKLQEHLSMAKSELRHPPQRAVLLIEQAEAFLEGKQIYLQTG